jgi:tyrosyl-tRNA synthetase
VKKYHGEKAAREAREGFEKTFSHHEVPNELPLLKISVFSGVHVKGSVKVEKSITALDMAMETGIFKSKSDARRLIEQGGFEYDGAAVKDTKAMLDLKNGAVLRIGKKNFFRIKN